MSDRTAEISAALKALGGVIGEAASGAGRCLEFARDRYETAAAHGWNGVAGNMELAAEPLEGVVEQFAAAERAAQMSARVLDEITDKVSSPEVVAHLGTASGHVDTAHGAAEASVGFIDDAVGHCEAAGQQSLPASLVALRDDVVAVVERLAELRDDVDGEQQEAEGFAEQDDGDDRDADPREESGKTGAVKGC